MIKKLSLILAVILCACIFVSCKDPDKPQVSVTPTDMKITDVTDPEKLVVVYKKDAGAVDRFAGRELSSVCEAAMGVKPVVREESAVGELNGDAFYFFIGDTEALHTEDIAVDYEELGEGGVLLKTVGKSVYLAGATERGTMNAVYEFLSYTFDYEFYADGEFYVDTGEAYWLDFDVKYRPSIGTPCLMYGELNGREDLFRRYSSKNFYDTWIGGYYAHTYFRILPPATYYAAHKNWYSPATDEATGEPVHGNNLCLTRDPAMIDEFVKNCKKIIESDTTRNFMMLGQEDNFDFCECPTCTAKVNQYGGFESAVALEFTIEVVDRLNEWLQAEHPERNITFVMFAYNATKEPPVTLSEGTYRPIDAELVAPDNLSVMYVINGCDYYRPYSTQSGIVSALDGWHAITKTLTIWEYATNFDDYFDTFDNWNSFGENVRLLESHGVDYIVEQASHNSVAANFSELRMYVQSRLMWDSSLSTETLIADFMTHYYKDAAEGMMKLFETTYAHVDELVEQYGVGVGSRGFEVMNLKNWPLTKLMELQGIVEETLAGLEPLAETDPELYNTLISRVKKQSLWVDNYMFRFYPSFVPDYNTAYAEWKALAQSYGITKISEGVDL